MLRRILLFTLGFFGFLLLFLVVTVLWSAVNTNCGLFGWLRCGDAGSAAGFPFTFMVSGGPPVSPPIQPSFYPWAFWADLTLALVGGVLSGFWCQRRWGR